jgi:5S rRNA maturation endonuclease (ribonuclease M5)
MDFLHGMGWSDEFIEEKGIKYCRYAEMIGENLMNERDEKPTVMQNRICIPVFKDGKLVNYECRTFIEGVEPKVKYVKSCSSNLIYNFDNIDLNKPVVITESIKNLGKGWGINKNIISTFGNQISDVKLEMLNKYVKELILFADFDQGGLRMVQTLNDKYDGDLKVTFCPKKYMSKENKLKGFDMNDCNLEQIDYYLNHTMNADKAIRLLSDDEENRIFW